MQKAILFLGDSFTWGEGLELYCDTPKWIAERDRENGWMQLVNKQDDDGIKFREQNRFATIVANHFNKIVLMDDKNGGSLARSIDIANKFLLDPDLYIDTIIIQFSAVSREPLHLDYWCRCDVCQETTYEPLYESFTYILEKVIENKPLSDRENYIFEYFKKRLKGDVGDRNFLDKFVHDRLQWYSNKLFDFYEKYVCFWNANEKRNVYFLDSWELETSYILHHKNLNSKIDWFTKNRIPLISENGKQQSRWEEWESTFKFKKIGEEFRGTANDHPTLKQHQYLAKSIIKFLEDKNYE